MPTCSALTNVLKEAFEDLRNRSKAKSDGNNKYPYRTKLSTYSILTCSERCPICHFIKRRLTSESCEIGENAIEKDKSYEDDADEQDDDDIDDMAVEGEDQDGNNFDKFDEKKTTNNEVSGISAKTAVDKEIYSDEIDNVDTDEFTKDSIDGDEESAFIQVYAGTSRNSSFAGSFYLHSLVLREPRNHDKIALTIYASPDSAAAFSNEVYGRMKLNNSGSEEAYSLIHYWLNTCLSSHQKCRQSISGDFIDESVEPQLPTRVIDVRPSDKHDRVRLIHSQGRRAHYITLSHCWGSSSLWKDRPLQTTKSTLKYHLVGISLSSLPKTFREAVTVTRNLGLRYIWIDSLCIVQDDVADWKQESRVMGLVYERSRITIAASSAKNSGEGLFLDRKIFPTAEVPYFSSDGSRDGKIFISVAPADDPDFCELETRAWATQEFLLSRRMVHYNRNQLNWTCKELETAYISETGHTGDSGIRNEWANVIIRYSLRNLTYDTDRLIALEGLATEMQKIRADTYTYGLWRGELPHNLLWSCVSPGQRLSQTPSWSWGSVVAGIWMLHDGDILVWKDICHQYEIRDSGRLHIDSLVRACWIRPMETSLPNSRQLRSILEITCTGKINYQILDRDNTVIGFAVLDIEVSLDGSASCLFVAQEERLDKEENCDDEDFSDDEQNPDLIVYCVLLLQRSQSNQDEYMRIGMGIVWDTCDAIRRRIVVA